MVNEEGNALDTFLRFLRCTQGVLMDSNMECKQNLQAKGCFNPLEGWLWFISGDYLIINVCLCLAPFELSLPHTHSILFFSTNPALKVWCNVTRNPKYSEKVTQAHIKKYKSFMTRKDYYYRTTLGFINIVLIFTKTNKLYNTVYLHLKWFYSISFVCTFNMVFPSLSLRDI